MTAPVLVETADAPLEAGAPEPADNPITLRRKRPAFLFWFAVAWIAVLTIAALTADLLPLRDPNELTGEPLLRPFTDWSLPLGTDDHSRDLLSRVVFGARASLAVGLLAVSLGTVIGGLLGLFAGFAKGRLQTAVTIVSDTFLAFPPLILLIAVTAVLGASLRTLILALSITTAPTILRLTRANTMVTAQRGFVRAARSLGASNLRVLFREITPNVVFPVLSYSFLLIAVVIVAEGSLSFIGVGITPPTPSWGGMIAAGKSRLDETPHVVLVPGFIMFLTVFALNVIGDHVRARFDVRASAMAAGSGRLTGRAKARLMAQLEANDAPAQGASKDA